MHMASAPVVNTPDQRTVLVPREIFEALEHLLQSDERFVVSAENFDLVLVTPAGKRLCFRPIPLTAPENTMSRVTMLRADGQVVEGWGRFSDGVRLIEAAEEIVDLQDQSDDPRWHRL